ncbi:MAG: hypothetical protein ACC634_08390 [Hyphomicrobiales bacterium]
MAGVEISRNHVPDLPSRLWNLGWVRLTMLLVLAVALVAAVAVLGLRPDDARPALLLLGALAGVGLLALVAGAAGLA